MSSNNYNTRYSTQVRPNLVFCVLICGGHLIFPLCSSAIENEDAPDQRNFDACQTIRYHLRNFGWVHRSMIRHVRESVRTGV